ncbi:MAG: hypothetical protein ACLTXL_08850 [Clostridia bacterium]
MKQQIITTVNFPVGSESDSFTAALSSALLPVLGYTADTPYWCSPNNRYCIHCSPCGEDLLAKHQEMLYHCLLTATTIAFGFEYPWDDMEHSLPGFRNGWRWDDDYLEYVMGFAGVTWKRLDRSAEKQDILGAIAEAIDNGLPVLARLGGEFDWQLITGYEGETLLGLDSHMKTLESHGVSYRKEGIFAADSWYETLRDAVILTGRCQRRVTYGEILEKIVMALSYPKHDSVEQSINESLDSVTADNAHDIAFFVAGINGVLIETRWHAAEAFCCRESILNALCTDDELRVQLSDLFFTRYIKDHSDETRYRLEDMERIELVPIRAICPTTILWTGS